MPIIMRNRSSISPLLALVSDLMDLGLLTLDGAQILDYTTLGALLAAEAK